MIGCLPVLAGSVIWGMISPLLFGAAGLAPENATVGKSLQTSSTVRLAEPAPEGGLQIVLTSSDPGKLLLSSTPDATGERSITLRVRTGFRQSPEFWLQALSDAGVVAYAATAPGWGAAEGRVTLAPSAILLRGPFRGDKFQTTPGAIPSRITLYSAMLDSAMNVVAEQAIAGGLTVNVNVTSSSLPTGRIVESPAAITGGSSRATTAFRPAAVGATTIEASVPPGFSRPAQPAKITAVVNLPGLGVTDQISIGENLQISGTLSLGELAPAGGVIVTLTSSDPEKLVLSKTPTELGSRSITIMIPPGGSHGSYHLQALKRDGTVTYTAAAPNFRACTGTVKLTPSGVVIAPASYGPPDEAALHEATETPRGFVSELARPTPTRLVTWMVQLDPVTKRGADVTVQPLRPGISLNVGLQSSNPAVGTVSPSSVTIANASDHSVAVFMPVGVGSTVVSLATPKGFTPPSNGTSIPVIVRP